MPGHRRYVLYRRWGNRLPLLRWVPKSYSTTEIRDMLPSDLVGKYAIVFGTSWQDAWDRYVKGYKTLVIDEGTPHA